MKGDIAYFHGCLDTGNETLENLFKALELNVETVSVTEWNCCGAPPAHYKPSFFNKVVMPLRNLGVSRRVSSSPLYSGCRVCVGQINEAVKIISSEPMFARRAEYSLEPFDAVKGAETDLFPASFHLLDIIALPEYIEKIIGKSNVSLKGSTILLYTGCYENIENIDSFKNMLSRLGANVFVYGECCGGGKMRNATPVNSERIKNANAIYSFFKSINKKADETCSDYILTVCSMCEKNIIDGIEMSSNEAFAPVVGLAEFISYVVGLGGSENFCPETGRDSSECCS